MNHRVGCIFALHLVFLLLLFFVFLALLFCYFLIFGNLSKNISENMEIAKTAKMKNAEENGLLTRAVSTVVFTNRVSFSCFVFL